MDFHLITQNQREQFKKHGYLIIKNAFDEKLINSLLEVGDQYMQTAGPIHNFYANRYINLTLDNNLIQLATNNKIVSLVVQLLSYDIHLMKGHIIYKYPQPTTNKPLYPDGDGRTIRNWHRDINNFDPNHPIRGTVAIRVGYCLTDFTSLNSGVTMFVPGSHKLHQPLRLKKGSLDPAEFIEPILKAGDAYLFSTSLYHTPAVNFTSNPTKVLLISYAYRWWAQQHPTPSEKVLAKMNPITAQLFCKSYEGEDLPIRSWAAENGLPVEDPPMRVYEN
tara:strand:- start:1871 stop:2701 length:831 start_codon:yes stop_codon:yes gene_type:complete